MSTISISTDKGKLNLELIHHVLTSSYWAKGRTIAEVQISIENSICFGIYKNDVQIGFARVVSDRIIFAYIMDVFILENHRGNGYGKKLMSAVLTDSKLNKVKKWYLITKDAQPLYKPLGFTIYEPTDRTVMRAGYEDLMAAKIKQI